MHAKEEIRNSTDCLTHNICGNWAKLSISELQVLARMTTVYSFGRAITQKKGMAFRFVYGVFAVMLLGVGVMYGQQNAGLGTATPHPSALLDMTSTTQGLLVPRMTSLQRTSIAAPANGLLVFDIDASQLYYYDAGTTSWKPLLAGQGIEASVILSPTVSTRNTVQPTLSTVTPLTLRGAVGQTATMFSVENSTAATLFSVGNGGAVTFTGALLPAGQAGTSGYILQSQGTGLSPLWVDPATLPGGGGGGTSATWSLTGNTGINAALNFLGTTDNQPLHFRTNNTTHATILANGNVGIGTANPQATFEISSAGSGVRFTNLTSASATNATNVGKILSVNANGDVVLVEDLQGSGTLPSVASAGMTLRHDGASWVTSSTLVNTGVNIGVGTTSPTRTLDVNGDVRIGASGTTITNIIKVTVSTTANFPLNVGDEVTLTFGVTGVAVGSSVIVSPQNALPTGFVISYARVSAANTVQFTVHNTGPASGALLAMDYYVTVIQ